MRTTTAISILALALPAAAGAGLGDVLASWETPYPSRDFNGIAYDGEYVWVKHSLSDTQWVFRCTKTGSVVAEIAFPYPAPAYHSYGLTFDGAYLWTIYHYWHIPYYDDYRKYTTTGSYAGGFSRPYIWGSEALTWDGQYIFTEFPMGGDPAAKYTTTGSLIASFPMPVRICSDIAYYRRQLWYYGGGGFVYGVTLNGSVTASFPAPGGRCNSAAFDGEYLWTLGANSYPQYVYKVDIDVVGVAPASLGRVKALYR